MILSWDINNLFTNPVTIACMAVFFGCFLIATIILIVLSVYKNIIQTIAKIIDLFDTISKSPLKNLIRRISNIYEETENLEKEYAVWRTKYELIYEKQLQKVMLSFVNLLKDRKTTKPTLANQRKYQKIYEDVIAINKTIHEVFVEIYSKLEIEYIQRDFITFLKELFTSIKEEAVIITFSDLDIDEKKLSDLISKIEVLFEDFYLNMEEGWLNQCWKILGDIRSALVFLIQLLEAIPDIFSSVEAVIPEKLLDLKNKHVTFGNATNEKLTSNAKAFVSLEKQVDILRVEVRNWIKKLQFKTASQKINEINDLIDNFKNTLEYDDKLKSYFSTRAESIKLSLENVVKATWNIQKIYFNTNNVSKIRSPERSDFEAARADFLKTKESFDLVFANFDVGINSGKEVNLIQLKDELLKVLTKAIDDIENLEKSTKIIEKNSTNIISLENQIIFLQSILSQCEVKINQFKSIQELKERFEESVNMEHAKLTSFSKERISKIKTNQEKEQAAIQLDRVANDIMMIFRDLNDAIFLDYISQEIMIYLERYVGKFDGVEQLIIQCEKLFKQRHLEQLINLSLDALTKIKRNDDKRKKWKAY
ncbi:septation ring formation regulator EzrA [Spiroplasma tabanidicola]|uniref:Septation ring formation regulator n=1 Tax=Spiroplasma tabanidicola TaxID=324079 RepID=A0A6I6CE91_9MOLU|nr:septation ring formation regulator EzrA [Spiroplasma tabanidicola]QGS52294.1 septation ring formation regulator [Spiroplasma tabanidicola]